MQALVTVRSLGPADIGQYRALARAQALPGLRQVNLGVNAGNVAARPLYESMGFVAFGLERGFMLVDGVLHDELSMVYVLPDRDVDAAG